MAAKKEENQCQLLLSFEHTSQVHFTRVIKLWQHFLSPDVGQISRYCHLKGQLH